MRLRLFFSSEPRPCGARSLVLSLVLLFAVTSAGCGGGSSDEGDPTPSDPSDPREEACADRNPQRNLYFGDLHVHTAVSFDASVFDVRPMPEDAYRFARGEALALPPLDAEGRGTQIARIDRPLDFVAVTDHSEFLGESEICSTPGLEGHESDGCRSFRVGGQTGQAIFGVQTSLPQPKRDEATCGADGRRCREAASQVWQRTIEAAEGAYDRTSACSFTTLVGYEYTANTGGSSQHRNVLFRGANVPPPISYMEQPAATGLWSELRRTCTEADGCQVLAIPHNTNQSNGNLFRVEYPGASTPAEEREQAEARSAIEPLVEIFQHKGDSECADGVSGMPGVPDELCEFEKIRPPPFEDCGDGTGAGGTGFGGCVSRRDFVRGVLLEGLREEERLAANPFRLGFVGGSDTHDGTPGAVSEDRFLGHRGNIDDEAGERLEAEGARSGVRFNPGGLAAVWAEENRRGAIFDALRRREVYATSGTRIAVRFFGGFDLGDDPCADPAMIEKAYAGGVPMGGVLDGAPDDGRAPSFLVSALRDPGTDSRAGTPLQRIQIVKGWIEAGDRRHRVYDVAGAPENGAAVDLSTCTPTGPGYDSLCALWRDPDFLPEQHAFYYARVVENPSCRWTAFACNALPPAERPESCGDPEVAKMIQERAWTSPIWWRARAPE